MAPGPGHEIRTTDMSISGGLAFRSATFHQLEKCRIHSVPPMERVVARFAPMGGHGMGRTTTSMQACHAYRRQLAHVSPDGNR
jgi:hypothetical protein